MRTDESISKASGFAVALEQASKPNYLGDPQVIEWLLRDYVNTCLLRVGPMRDERLEAAKMDMADAYKIADILLGKSGDYAPIPAWNRPGIIDRWLVDQTHVLGDTPEERVARTLVIYLCRMYDLLIQCENNPDEEGDQLLVDGLVQEYTCLLTGCPEWNFVEV